MVLIDLVSTSRRRERIGRFVLCPTSRDVGTQPHNDNDISSESDFFLETCNKELEQFLACQGLLVAHLNQQRGDSKINSLDSFWMIAKLGSRISQLLCMGEKKEAGSKISMAERSFLKQSLTKLDPILHAILEGIFVHLYSLLWHSSLSLVSCWEMHARMDIALGSQHIIWSAGIKRFSLKQRKDSFGISARWTDQTSDVGFDSCCFPVRQFRVQTANLTCQRTCTSSGAHPDLCDILPFDSLCCSVQREPSLLLTHGNSGYGKTWRCERCILSLDKPMSGCTRPLRARPDLPVDLNMGVTKKRGSRMISFLAYVELPLNRISCDSVLLLDDFDLVCTPITKIMSRGSERSVSTSGQCKVQGQCAVRSTMSIHRGLDTLRQRAKDLGLIVPVQGSKMIALATSRDTDALPLTMFDQVLEVRKPRDDDRRALMSEILCQRSTNFNNIEQSGKCIEIGTLQHCGCTWSEFMRKCRESIIDQLDENGKRVALDLEIMRRAIKIFGETSAQGKLKGFTGQGDNGIKVWGPSELTSLLDAYRNGVDSGALLPWEQRREWAQLEAGILTPLCHSQDLKSLLRQDNDHHNKAIQWESLAGVLLTGASGKGKSSIARHCAAFASALIPTLCLIEVNCVCLVRKEIGESERAIKHVFDLARSAAPSVLVLDGINNIATVRGKDSTTHGTMDRILSTLLMHMDGFQGDSRQPAVIGVADQSDWVDQALCRPGRLAMTIEIS